MFVLREASKLSLSFIYTLRNEWISVILLFDRHHKDFIFHFVLKQSTERSWVQMNMKKEKNSSLVILISHFSKFFLCSLPVLGFLQIFWTTSKHKLNHRQLLAWGYFYKLHHYRCSSKDQVHEDARQQFLWFNH